MATTIYSEQFSMEAWWFFTKTATEYSEASSKLYRYPYPKFGIVKKQYMNKVWDVVAGGWVFWQTNYPDPDGGYYKGPGIYGIDTFGHSVETLVHGREQL